MVFKPRGLRTYTRRGVSSSEQFDGLMYQEQAFDFKRANTSSPFTSVHVIEENKDSQTERPVTGAKASKKSGTAQAKKRASEGSVDDDKKKRKYSRTTNAKLKLTKDGSNVKSSKKTMKQKTSVPAFEMLDMFTDMDMESPAREMPEDRGSEPDVETVTIEKVVHTPKERKSTKMAKATLPPDKEMAAKDKVRAWMAKSLSPRSMDSVDSDSSIEITRGEKLAAHRASQNRLFTDEFYSNLHKVVSPMPARFESSQPHDTRPWNSEVKLVESTEPTDLGTLTELTSGVTSGVTTGLTSELVTGSLLTGTRLISKYTIATTGSDVQTETGTDGTDGSEDDIYAIPSATDHAAGDLSPIPDQPEQPEMFKIPALTAVYKPGEPKTAKFLSSTMKGTNDDPYEFPDMSTIHLTESVKQRRTEEKTPKRKTSFATPKSPSKSHKVSGHRRSREQPKTSTRLFQTDCADVDATPQLSTIQKSSGAKPHFFKSSLSTTVKETENNNIDMCDIVETEDQHRNINTTGRSENHVPITTSTPNKGAPPKGGMHFDMDISSVSIGSVEDLQFHQSTREINSAEILHLSDTHIDIQEGQVDGNTAKIQKEALADLRTMADKNELLNSLCLVKQGLKFDKVEAATKGTATKQTTSKAREERPGKESNKSVKVTRQKGKIKRPVSDAKVKVSVKRFGELKYTVSRNKAKKVKLKNNNRSKSQIRSSTPCDAVVNMPDLMRRLFCAVTPIEKDSLRVAKINRGDHCDGTVSCLQNKTAPCTILTQSRSLSSTKASCTETSKSSPNIPNSEISSVVPGRMFQSYASGAAHEGTCQTKLTFKHSAKCLSHVATSDGMSNPSSSCRLHINCATPDTVIHSIESPVINTDNNSCPHVRNVNGAGDNVAVSLDIPDVCTLMNEQWTCARKPDIHWIQYVDTCDDSYRNAPEDDLL